jgi:error-prone DNA polymerase
VADWRDVFGERTYLLAELYRGVDDAQRLDELQRLARAARVPLVAAGDVLYHAGSRLPLANMLTAIRHKTTVAEATPWLEANAERHLQSLAERESQFAAVPDALRRTAEIAEQCQFCLSELRYEYPEELAPAGRTPMEYLRELSWRGARRRYPAGVPETVRQQIEHELALIDELHYEAFFLTVWDLVRFARQRGILCQGRGSAANSAVCYVLGITSVDPAATDLLFERFLSRERNEAPDIDVDFEHERREEVLQYLYTKYGRDRAGLAATVITYRARSALRDVGRALGVGLDRIAALTRNIDGYASEAPLDGALRAAGIDPESASGRHLVHLVDQILGFPRHLSQHVGGMVITRGALCELAPIENAAMDGRTVIPWDKDDLEELGLLKVDCLCLGMLTAIRKCLDLVQLDATDATRRRISYVAPIDPSTLSLATIPPDDPRVYDMICAADTVGVFQIESRGQMSMLPRLKPRSWYDLVIEVAIVRPGPIQGQMVHPYLRRRAGLEPVTYPNEAIRRVLDRTLGVPIFQEQAMKLAVVAAGFTPGEADQLRRAMGAWRKTGVIEQFREKLLRGMRQRGLSEEFAEQVFRQIRGFGEYGFPESHAASFAHLVYVSAWLKYYYPAAFTAALLNSQPMGFYAPAQLVADARRHGVEVRGVDTNFSDWDCTLERDDDTAPSLAADGHLFSASSPGHLAPPSLSSSPALRLGLRLVSGLSETAGRAIEQARRAGGPFLSLADLTRRARLSAAVGARLSAAGALTSLRRERRQALWDALAIERHAHDQPLLATVDTDDETAPDLPPVAPYDEVVADYRTIGLSLRAHPMSFLRSQLERLRAVPAARLADTPDGRRVCVAGLVILRQRPSTAKGITFVTLEDETGTANLVVKQHVWQRDSQVARTSPAWIVRGKLERRSGVIHVIADRLEDFSHELARLGTRSRDFR